MTGTAQGRVFFDTNVLVYLFASDEPDKQARARQLFAATAAANEIVISVQVLQEFFVTVTRRSLAPLSPAAADQEVRRLCAHEIVRTDELLVLAGIARSAASKISFWDALIVEAALRAHCATLYTEDLQGGWQVDGRLMVVNPFA